MAISRAQLAKELEPGLNALFGLEYNRYENEHAEIFEEETSDRAFEEEVMLGGFSTAPVKGEGTAVTFDDAQKLTQHVIHMRLLLSLFQLLKRLLRIICMTALHLVIQKLLLVQWLRQSKLKLRLS